MTNDLVRSELVPLERDAMAVSRKGTRWLFWTTAEERTIVGGGAGGGGSGCGGMGLVTRMMYDMCRLTRDSDCQP